MTTKDQALALATLTFLVRLLLHQQTKRGLQDIRRTLEAELNETKMSPSEGLFSFAEFRDSVESFLKQFPEI